MFQELFELARSSGALTMMVAADAASGKLTVIVSPKGGEAKDEPALSTPLSLTATPEELDEGFFDAVSSYRTARTSLADQVAATTEVLAAAREASVAKGSKAVTKALPKLNASTKVAPKADDNTDDEDDDDAVGGEMAPGETATPSVGAGTSDNLFGD